MSFTVVKVSTVLLNYDTELYDKISKAIEKAGWELKKEMGEFQPTESEIVVRAVKILKGE